jgi:hypothetical protein
MAVTRFSAIEARRTKFVPATGISPEDMEDMNDRMRISNIMPDETFGKVVAYLNEVKETGGALNAIGDAHFGPMKLDKSSSHWRAAKGCDTRFRRTHRHTWCNDFGENAWRSDGLKFKS